MADSVFQDKPDTPHGVTILSEPTEVKAVEGVVTVTVCPGPSGRSLPQVSGDQHGLGLDSTGAGGRRAGGQRRSGQGLSGREAGAD